MNIEVKQKLFDEFLFTWGKKFNMVFDILNYINSYPELMSRIKDYKPLSKHELEELQLEWVCLLT